VDERTVLQVLRLFNLCDIGPTVVKASSATSKAVEPPANGAATASKPTSRAGSAGGSGLAGDSKEEGELGEESPKDSGPPPPPPPMAASAPVGASSIAVDGEELTSRATVRPARGSKGELTQRQRARMADASRLLGVILKTSSLSAQNLFVRCGVLRQLLSCFGHNIKESYNSSAKDAYSTVLAKMLTLVLALSPLSADDVHLTRSANGSFADLARKLTQSRNYEVKNKAWEVLKKFPASACTRPVAGQEGVWHSSAGSTRTRGPPGPAATPSRDRDGDYPSPRPSPYGPPPGRAGSMGYSRELPQAPPSRLGGGGGGPRPQGPAHPGRGGQWGSPAPLPAPGTAPRERPYANGAPWSHEPPPGSRKRSRWDSGEPGPPPVNGAGGRAPMPYPAPHHPSSPPSYGGPPPPRDGPGGYGRGPGGPPPFSEPPSKYRAWAARPDSAQGTLLKPF